MVVAALCLAVGTVPVHQHHQGDDEEDVGDQQGVGNAGDHLVPVTNEKTMIKHRIRRVI